MGFGVWKDLKIIEEGVGLCESFNLKFVFLDLSCGILILVVYGNNVGVFILFDFFLNRVIVLLIFLNKKKYMNVI